MNDIDQVRLMISDNVLPYHYTDAQITAFLAMAGGSVLLAAAFALKAWAASLTATLDSERIGDYSYSNNQAAKKIELADEYIKLNATSPVIGTGIGLTWAEMDLASVGEIDD